MHISFQRIKYDNLIIVKNENIKVNILKSAVHKLAINLY